MGGMPYAVQLYSVRDYLERDVAGGLRGVKEAGFDYVELAGTYGHPAAAFEELLESAGLKAMSAHVPFEEVTGNPAQAIADAKVFGVDYVVIPWLGGAQFGQKQAWIDAAKAMDAAGAALREAGLRLCYHNHDHEFVTFEGRRIFDLIFETAAPENLAVQLDAGWSTVGGADTPALIRQLAGRIPLLHIKDFRRGLPPVVTEIGRGDIDWAPVLEAAREAGVAWCIAEQDDSETDSMASAKANAAYLAKHLL